MFKCILVDDEIPSLDELEFLINRTSNFQVVGKISNPKKVLLNVELSDVDVIFLDINMPGINGIELASMINEINDEIMIIFVTAYDKYAVEAFEVNAIDYLQKPLSEERLKCTISKIEKILKNKNTKDIDDVHFEKFKEFILNFTNQVKSVTLQKDGKHYPVKSDDIKYIYFENRLSKVVTNDKVFEVNKGLSDMAKHLKNPDIIRCHKSYLVNIKYITEILPWFNQTYMLKIEGEDLELPVSRNKIKEFKKKMNIL